jgi:enolase 1/2/3
MATLSSLRADEVLDSRGNPTLRVTAVLDDGSAGEACVPSGASTGAHEAHELRDGDPKRYSGKGVLKAVANVEGEMQDAVKGMSAEAQATLDEKLKSLDGTRSKSRLGANAILGVSLAVARAAAVAARLPLYAYLRRLTGAARKEPFVLPLPLMNVVNGGRHADSGLDVQEFMVLPVGAPSFREALRMGAEVFHMLGALLKKEGRTTSVGDEGGYAPVLERNDEVFPLLERAVDAAGYRIGTDIVFGIDAAASEFYDARQKSYVLRAPSVVLPRERLIALLNEWVGKHPLKTIEDPLEQDDWEGWTQATEKFRSEGVQVVGDDLFATNSERLKRGMEQKAATAILVKVNQIGTLSETLSVIQLAQQEGYGVVISHRSGETADTFIADLAVATNAGQIKTGSLSRSERVEKYNRLLAIERELGERAIFPAASRLFPPRKEEVPRPVAADV